MLDMALDAQGRTSYRTLQQIRCWMAKNNQPMASKEVVMTMERLTEGLVMMKSEAAVGEL